MKTEITAVRPATIVLRAGQTGTSSGYPCSVVRHYDGNMYEFRFSSGVACIDASDFVPDEN